MSLLQVENLSIQFGGLTAVDNVSFTVEPDEVFTIVGPNGAGKSTIFNLISRIYQPTSGSISVDQQEITSLKPEAVAAIGIARTFQNIELFDHSTVLQNLLVGRHVQSSRARRSPLSLMADLMFFPSVRRDEIRHREAVEKVIDFLDLQPYRNKMIAGLPYGVRKVVEVGRALASEPRLLLLDEPASGLSVEETQDMAYWISDIKREMGITVLMIEHDMTLVNQVSDRVLALDHGAQLALGTPLEVQQNPAVIEAYLGSAAAERISERGAGSEVTDE